MISHELNFTLNEIHVKSKGHSDTVMYEKTKGIVKIFCFGTKSVFELFWHTCAVTWLFIRFLKGTCLICSMFVSGYFNAMLCSRATEYGSSVLPHIDYNIHRPRIIEYFWKHVIFNQACGQNLLILSVFELHGWW